MFAAVVIACGGVAVQASSAADAILHLEERPHVLLLDAALPDPEVEVPARAVRRGVPIVAFMFRLENYTRVPDHLRVFQVRALRSTDLMEVCHTLRDIAREAA